MCDKVMCDKVVFVTKLCVCEAAALEAAEAAAEAARDTESKTRTPHKDVGKKHTMLGMSTFGS